MIRAERTFDNRVGDNRVGDNQAGSATISRLFRTGIQFRIA